MCPREVDLDFLELRADRPGLRGVRAEDVAIIPDIDCVGERIPIFIQFVDPAVCVMGNLPVVLEHEGRLLRVGALDTELELPHGLHDKILALVHRDLSTAKGLVDT